LALGSIAIGFFRGGSNASPAQTAVYVVGIAIAAFLAHWWL
jgi:hypothetical protein